MSRSKILRQCFLILSFVLVGALGCGSQGSTVSGTVTYNGQAVEKGHINFIPADGKGTPVGGDIKNGKYEVRGVIPGKNRVEVSSYTAAGTDSMGDAVKGAKAKLAADAVAPTDEGNGKIHEIGSGSTELDLKLTTASSSDGKSR
jgi:hypothetical protein